MFLVLIYKRVIRDSAELKKYKLKSSSQAVIRTLVLAIFCGAFGVS